MINILNQKFLLFPTQVTAMLNEIETAMLNEIKIFRQTRLDESDLKNPKKIESH